MNYRDLEAVRQILLEATGLEVAYAYDDLVFPEETLFILKYDEKNVNHLFCYFHKDFELQARGNVMDVLMEKAEKKQVTISYAGDYVLKENEENKAATDIVFL